MISSRRAGTFAALLMSLMAVTGAAQQEEPEQDRHSKFNVELRKQLETGRRLAVVIGIDGYPTMPLKCCVRDAELLAATLRDRCGYDPDGILVMTDRQTDPALQPTSANLRTQISQFLNTATPNDTILVSYSGHGGLRLTGTGAAQRKTGYICPLDFDGSRAEQTSLEIDDLRTMLQECRAAQKLLILDSCHSGGAGAASGFSISETVGRSFQNAQGLITFSACRMAEISSEDREVGQGVFTLSFVRGLEGLADFDQNRIIDSDELYRHVLSEVPANVAALYPGRNQTPVRIIGQDVVGVFALSPVLPRPKATAAMAHMRPGEVMRNSIGIPLVLLPRGSFIKGSPSSEYKRHSDESFKAVIIAKRILIGVHEVTQTEYAGVMGHNPAFHSKDGGGADRVAELKTGRFPVEQVSWIDANEFCLKLSQSPEEAAAGRIYRLPTESEWEFACRGGSSTAFTSGQIIEGEHANIRSDQPYWYARQSKWSGRTRTVESHAKNNFGLCDMHGNVAEWCQDFYDPDPSGLHLIHQDGPLTNNDPVALVEHLNELLRAPVSDQLTSQMKQQIWADATDPQGPPEGTHRVIRGGSYLSDVAQCRSGARKAQLPEYTHKALGFRVVCEQKGIGR